MLRIHSGKGAKGGGQKELREIGLVGGDRIENVYGLDV